MRTSFFSFHFSRPFPSIVVRFATLDGAANVCDACRECHICERERKHEEVFVCIRE